MQKLLILSDHMIFSPVFHVAYILIFCAVLFLLCVVYPKLSVSLDCPIRDC